MGTLSVLRYPGWWRFHLHPRQLRRELRHQVDRLRATLRERRQRVAHLRPGGEPTGRALLSYLVEPCLGDQHRQLPHGHTHHWEAREIAQALVELDFVVDVIDWTDSEFEPRQRYDVVVDVRCNLERLAPLVGDRCLLLQHMETAHHTFHNAAQQQRLEALQRRRGTRLRPRRLIEENRAIEVAHAGTTVGNEFTISTYAFAGKPIWRIPISTPRLFPEPREKDLDLARRHWIWFGSGGLVHKGLDLVLEAFAGLPDHRLTVCGPIERERDFVALYGRELFATPNIRLLGWVDIAGERFRRLVDSALGVVYPSCSEGGGGSVITCMHAGLLPLVTSQTSVDLDGFGFLLDETTPEAIRREVGRISALPAEELRRRTGAAWRHARENHTRESFARDVRHALSEIVDRWRRGEL